MCFDHDDYPEFQRSDMICARKDHRCSECGLAIPRGSVHEYYIHKFDGRLAALRFCERCLWMAARIYAEEIAAGCSSHESYPPLGEGKLARDYYDHVIEPVYGEHGLTVSEIRWPFHSAPGLKAEAAQ